MIGKSLHLCFSRLKRPSTNTPPQSQNPLPVPTPSTSSPSSSSSVVFKNFNSLYDHPAAASDSETLTISGFGSGFGSGSASTYQTLTLTLTPSSSSFDSSDTDISTAIASRRLLRAAPGRSNSIVDAAVGIGAVPKYSPDPREEFRRSMEEVVAALGIDGRSGAPSLLQELLLCYLAINRRSAHRYIVGAFADLLRALSAAAAAGEDGVER